MSFLSFATSLAYRSIELGAMSLGASSKVTATFDYRRRWTEFCSNNIRSNSTPSLWIHGASVGELEDLASFFTNSELLKKAGYSSDSLVLTSSSPSAEAFLERMSQKIHPRYAGPLPPDVAPRIDEFFARVNPELLILSQSDIWPTLLLQAQTQLKRGLVWLPHKDSSAKLLRDIFIRPIVKAVGLRHKNSKSPWAKVPSVFVGSPRIDRIFERIDQANDKVNPLEEWHKKNSGKFKVLLASAWKEDARVLAEATRKFADVAVAVIPHDPGLSAEVAMISHYFGSSVFAREGILLESYRGFDLAMVGGAFRTGLHNVIEPLAWGLPTVVGPDLKKQPDAPLCIKEGALKSFRNSHELKALLEKIRNKDSSWSAWKNAATQMQAQLRNQRGASERLAELVASIE